MHSWQLVNMTSAIAKADHHAGSDAGGRIARAGKAGRYCTHQAIPSVEVSMRNHTIVHVGLDVHNRGVSLHASALLQRRQNPV
jgi:hypothetical protein